MGKRKHLPSIIIEDIWNYFPKSKRLIENWLLCINDESSEVGCIQTYIKLINDPGRFQVVVSCRLEENITTQKGNLKYDDDNFFLETIPEELTSFHIEIINPSKQSIEEQYFTICHEFGHLFIGYEICGQYFSEKGRKVPLAWATNLYENSEELCDFIAEILTKKRPLI
jgi:hypothetical protein